MKPLILVSLSRKRNRSIEENSDFPAIIAEAAEKRIPHRITNYIYDLASTFHSFYNAEKVLDKENAELTKARLALIKAVQITLKNALALIGVSAPEKM